MIALEKRMFEEETVINNYKEIEETVVRIEYKFYS